MDIDKKWAHVRCKLKSKLYQEITSLVKRLKAPNLILIQIFVDGKLYKAICSINKNSTDYVTLYWEQYTV